MSISTFSFKPAAVPQAGRGSRGSKYGATVDKVRAYLEEHKDVQSVEVELGGVSLKSAAASFRNIIGKKYRGSLRLQQRGERLYISRVP